MSKVLQICLLVGSLFVLFIVIRNVLKNKMNIHFAVVWIIWGIGMVILSLFPNIVYHVSNLIGVQIPVNAVFLIMIFLLYCITFYIYFIFSKYNEILINLNYEVATLKKKLEDLEKEKEND